MESQRLKLVKEFKYLGFTWTSKMSLKPTIDETLENIQKTFCKLRWMKGGKALSKNVSLHTVSRILPGYSLYIRSYRKPKKNCF
jgi:hypothetical protein